MFKFVLAALVVCVPAQAATSYSCQGGILDYAFLLTGAISGGRATDSAHVRVTKGGRLLQLGTAPVVSSQFTSGQSFSVTSQDAHARIAVDTRYQEGSYDGTMAIQSDQGNTSVSTRCVLR